MMWNVHSLSVSLVDCLLKECEDRKPYRELYEYSLETILSMSLNLMVIIIIASILGVMENVAYFFLFFFPYRFLFGGAHAKTNLQCIVISNVCLFVCVYLARAIPVMKGMLVIELSVLSISMVVNFYYARVTSISKRVGCLMIPACLLVIINLGFESYVNGICATLGMLTQAISFYKKIGG
ncbi:MAG: accessory gene regulator B family protein [Clostridium sp.]|nr:accessory gene regulator B family protein [Clostridium sp.]